MASIAEIKAAAAAKTAALTAANPGNAAAELKKQIAETKPPEEVKQATGTKRYFAKVASSRFIFSDGVEVFFHWGRLDVGPDNKSYPTMKDMWPAYQRELDAILGNNPMIFVNNDQIIADPKVEQNAKTDGEVANLESSLGANVKIKQEIGTTIGSGMPSDVNQSTVDPRIRQAMMGGGAITTEGATELADKLNAGAAG